MSGTWESLSSSFQMQVVCQIADDLFSCNWLNPEGYHQKAGGFMATETHIRRHFRRIA